MPSEQPNTSSSKEQLTQLFKRTADAIREKDGTTEETDKIYPEDYPDRIKGIQTGIDTSDADAGPDDIVSGKTAYVNGEKITGTIETAESGSTIPGDATVTENAPNLSVVTTTENPILIPGNSEIKMEVPLSDFGDATRNDVVSGKTFTSELGFKKTGAIPMRNATTDVVRDGPDVKIPAGLYPHTTTFSGIRLEHPSPSISRSGATITATHTQGKGYTEGGTTSATLNLSTQSGYTVTPSTYSKVAIYNEYFATGNIYVQGDSNLVASNIKSGVSIFGVNGSYKGSKGTTVYLYYLNQYFEVNIGFLEAGSRSVYWTTMSQPTYFYNNLVIIIPQYAIDGSVVGAGGGNLIPLCSYTTSGGTKLERRDLFVPDTSVEVNMWYISIQ